MSRTVEACPSCSGTGHVVTAVPIATLGRSPRTILITRLCATSGCHLKYTSQKPEPELDDEERAAFRTVGPAGAR